MVYKWTAPIQTASWYEETVLYHQCSGETYLFSGTAKAVLNYCIATVFFSKQDVIDNCYTLFADRHQAETFIDSLINGMLQKDLIIIEAP